MNLFDHQLEGFTRMLRLRNYSQRSIRTYTDHLCNFFAWLGAHTIFDLREVTASLLTQYHAELTHKNYSLHTLHIKLRSITRLFAWLEETSSLLFNPAEAIKLPHLGDRLPKNILSIHEMKRLLATPNPAAPTGLRNRAILELLYSAGLRTNECIGLTLHDVDYQGGYLRVNQGKGSKQRVVPLGSAACEYLKQYLLKIRPCFAGENPDIQALFLISTGKPLTHQALSVMVKKLGRRAGIEKPVTVHTIRRAFATHMLKNNVHPLYLQRLLGHVRSDTMKKYIKITNTDVKATHKKTHPREKDKK